MSNNYSDIHNSIYSLIQKYIEQEINLGDYSSLFISKPPPKPGKILKKKINNSVPESLPVKQARVAETPAAYSPKHSPKTDNFKIPAGDKKTQLDALRNHIGNCDMCPQLAGYRKNIVFGAGNPNADVMFIGEAPGRDEDIQGMPFVGRSGRLLTDIIEKGMKIKRVEVYIANILKCRPPNNRDPLPVEEENCTPFLNKQLEIIQPKVIIALGRYAAQYLLNTTTPIGKLRGHFHDYKNIPVMPTYHPAYLIRNYSKDNRLRVWNDIKMVVDLLEKTAAASERNELLG